MIKPNFKASLVLKLLKDYEVALETNPAFSPEEFWQRHLLKEQIEAMSSPTPTGHELLNRVGGDWLGTARSWIQGKAVNGECVTWGSNEVLNLRSPLTVDALESLAADCAAAALAEVFQVATIKELVK